MILFNLFFNLFISNSLSFNIPKISLLIPIYNTKYFDNFLHRVIYQSLKNIEIICINDEKSKLNLEVIMKFTYDNRIIILNNLKNINFINIGLEFASGKYFAIVDSNDLINNNIFENLYKLTENGYFDIIRTNNYLIYEKKIVDKYKILKFLYNKIFFIFKIPNNFKIHSFIWKGIFKKDILFDVKFQSIKTTGKAYKDIFIFFQQLFKLLNKLNKYKNFVYYKQTYNNYSLVNEKNNKLFNINKNFYEIGKYFKKNFNRNDLHFNKTIISIFMENLNIINNKRLYIKYFYKEIYEILKTRTLKEIENKFLKFLYNYGREIFSDFYEGMNLINKNYPKISIIMPIYNSENYIKESLNSLINQTFKNFELICINDGSTDNTLNILKEYEKNDERIEIINQDNMGAGIARNVGMKKAKGDYLIFLDSDDIFEQKMLEELFITIITNNVDIVICNSINFNSENFLFEKNYIIPNEKINKSFSSFEIKKDFFNFFIWLPWDKIFKKKFIENLGINFQNLKSTNDLFFIASSVIIAKNISFIDKIFIKHRVGIKNSIENSRYKTWENFYYALKSLKKFMKEKNLYKRFKQDFINYVASFSIWNLETIFEEPFCFLYLKLKNEWFNEFGVSKHNEAFFYNNNIYKKIKYILNSELEQIENRNEVDENLFHINDQKFFCIPKVTVIITIYNSEKYLSDCLNSIINQTLKEIEIICINDGSTDNSLKILNYYKKKDNRIIIFNRKNKGVNSARNLGLKNAKGEFILFFDSDDLLITEALEKLYNLGKYKNLDIIFFNLKFIFENNITEIQFPNIFYKINSFKIIKSGKDIFLNMIKENKFILSPCLQFINHKFLLKNKIKFLKRIKYDDILFFYNLILKVNRTFETDEIFYLKKINEKFNKKTDKLIKKLNDYIISIKDLFNQSITFYNKNNIINQSFELIIDSVEELIFFVFNKIQKNKLFLINQFHQNDKILLILILNNKKINTNFIQNIIKNDNQFYYYTYLFNKFEKNYCFKLKYKINIIKKILNFKL